jgi:AAHS family 3-hydroxyphenylpropionic acid transporter
LSANEPAISPPGIAAWRGHAVVALCFAIAALEGYDLQTLGVAAPVMGPQLHLAKPIIGYAASATMAAMGVGAAAGGWLADRIGRRTVLFVSVLVFAVASGLTVWVDGAPTLFAARVLTGAGVGGAMPNLITVAADAYPGARRAAAVTLLMAGLPAGAGACALLDRFTAAELGWPMLFIVGGLAAAPVAPLIVWLAPGRAPRTHGEAGADVFGHLFGHGRSAVTALLWLAICLTMVVLTTMTTWLPTLMIEKGLSHEEASTVTFVFNGIGVAAGLGFGPLMDRFGFVRPLMATFCLMAVAAVALALATGFSALAFSAGLVGLGCCSSQFGLYALFPRYYLADARATGSGAGVAAGRVGSVLGPGLCGVLLGLGASPGHVVAALTPAAVAGGVAVAALAVVGRKIEASARAV